MDILTWYHVGMIVQIGALVLVAVCVLLVVIVLAIMFGRMLDRITDD